MNPLQCSLEYLRRADLPVGTMELAQYLIGKTLVHKLPTARLSGVIVETEAYPPGDAAGLPRQDTRQSVLVSRSWLLLCLFYLWLFVHGERHQ